jgi:hypothetical protein
MKHSDHGIVKDGKGQEQPKDTERAQVVHKTDPCKSASHEATRDPALPKKRK